MKNSYQYPSNKDPKSGKTYEYDLYNASNFDLHIVAVYLSIKFHVISKEHEEQKS